MTPDFVMDNEQHQSEHPQRHPGSETLQHAINSRIAQVKIKVIPATP